MLWSTIEVDESSISCNMGRGALALWRLKQDTCDESHYKGNNKYLYVYNQRNNIFPGFGEYMEETRKASDAFICERHEDSWKRVAVT